MFLPAPKISLPVHNHWTLKDRDELFLFCQRLGRERQGFQPLYALQRELSEDQWIGKEDLFPIIVHECFSSKFSSKDVDSAVNHIDIIDPRFRDGFAIGLALCSADLGRNSEMFNDTILRLGITEEEAVQSLLRMPKLFRGEQYAIRLRPMLTPRICQLLETNILITAGETQGAAPTQRFMSSLYAYMTLCFDQGKSVAEVLNLSPLKPAALNAVKHLLIAERMTFQANIPMLRMLSGWIRGHIKDLEPLTSPFLAIERLKTIAPSMVSKVRELPESWRKLLLVNQPTGIEPSS
ncbi:hypothetical protein DV532_28940 (plasmid) [Pseudomonas sp. Leaf58]|nr:hypothetical protein [Pseudomonas sp. Leaf58]AYG48292.1 hypothetical protein DV532_28940 [Pseudomonas sp. Leaf58]KQN62161.1 hypothetical protein ASF02_08330 [Pseudomonas sp. Leaf58]